MLSIGINKVYRNMVITNFALLLWCDCVEIYFTINLLHLILLESLPNICIWNFNLWKISVLNLALCFCLSSLFSFSTSIFYFIYVNTHIYWTKMCFQWSFSLQPSFYVDKTVGKLSRNAHGTLRLKKLLLMENDPNTVFCLFCA